MPCEVLDPFSGTATTGVAAAKLGRNYTGIELRPEYAAIGEARMAEVAAPVPGQEVAPAAPAGPVQLALVVR